MPTSASGGPLCHIAHPRPTFRASDWEYYQQANRKFAEALLEELAGTIEPMVLVQYFHFALLPRLIKERRPDARVAVFWHIPWPNPQAFGICPGERNLLEGLLGADLVGFHIQAHCNFFMETADGALEARVDWERFTVNRGGHLTRVRPFPIRVALPEFAPALRPQVRAAGGGLRPSRRSVDLTGGIFPPCPRRQSLCQSARSPPARPD